MPAWFSHPGILIINRLTKKKRLCGLAIVWGSLVPDLEFVYQIAWGYIIYQDFNEALAHHGQAFFHSIFGLVVTIPLTILLTILTSNFIKKILSHKFFSFLKIKNLEKMEHTIHNPPIYIYILSAFIGAMSAIIFDVFTHDHISVFYPFYPTINNPLLVFGIDSFTLWIIFSIILFVAFLIALYQYPVDEL